MVFELFGTPHVSAQSLNPPMKTHVHRAKHGSTISYSARNKSGPERMSAKLWRVQTSRLDVALDDLGDTEGRERLREHAPSLSHPTKNGTRRNFRRRQPIIHCFYWTGCPTSNNRNDSALVLLVRFGAANVNTKNVRNFFKIVGFEESESGPPHRTAEPNEKQRQVTLAA
jgi:hypothetical protein